jgi:hypothetical protein
MVPMQHCPCSNKFWLAPSLCAACPALPQLLRLVCRPTTEPTVWPTLFPSVRSVLFSLSVSLIPDLQCYCCACQLDAGAIASAYRAALVGDSHDRALYYIHGVTLTAQDGFALQLAANNCHSHSHADCLVEHSDAQVRLGWSSPSCSASAEL